MVNATPRPLYPRERPGTHCIGGWVGLRAGLDGCRKSRPPPGFDPRTVQTVASRCTDWAMPTHRNVLVVSRYPLPLMISDQILRTEISENRQRSATVQNTGDSGVDKSAAHWFHPVWEVLSSNRSHGTASPSSQPVLFSTVQSNSMRLPEFRARPLPHPCQFIIHWSLCH